MCFLLFRFVKTIFAKRNTIRSILFQMNNHVSTKHSTMSEKKKAQQQAAALDIHYLQQLSRLFPTVAAASTEIINLEAILNLPKGTEHFLTDIHGEYEAFQHVLKNASGSIKRKVNDIFGNTLRESEKKALCTLIYYPQEKLQIVKEKEKDINDWYLTTLTNW